MKKQMIHMANSTKKLKQSFYISASANEKILTDFPCYIMIESLEDEPNCFLF